MATRVRGTHHVSGRLHVGITHRHRPEERAAGERNFEQKVSSSLSSFALLPDLQFSLHLTPRCLRRPTSDALASDADDASDD
ncbi:hypothetical protein NL676_036108 [Syzygium grande]|nr:hypothetical protein NL676_036108 [Syzygium grande]